VEIPATARVSMDVFDVAGRRVARRDAGVMTRGWREIYFDGRDDASRLLASGVYFVRVTAGPYRQTQKLTLRR
jgi:hypothetical protein